jgi:LmbE family N-acetylglucosaminyl deacetylase
MTGTLRPGELGTILGVWAHPDDEAYLMAGTALLAAAAGSTVACVTATAGEAGESADEERWPPAQLGTIRRTSLPTASPFSESRTTPAWIFLTADSPRSTTQPVSRGSPKSSRAFGPTRSSPSARTA